MAVRTQVYLDTNILKYAADRLMRFLPQQKEVNWGGHELTLTHHREVVINPNDRIKDNDELRREISLLRKVAGRKRLRFAMQIETVLESWGLPNMDSEEGIFFGREIETVAAPVEYSRTLIEAHGDASERQYEFLCSIDHPRFNEIQRATGAFQGKNKRNKNQLLDAWHLWSAEHNECSYFLTLDGKLARSLEQSRTELELRVVGPSQLLNDTTLSKRFFRWLNPGNADSAD